MLAHYVDEVMLQVTGVIEQCLIHTFLHQSPNSVVNRVQVRTV